MSQEHLFCAEVYARLFHPAKSRSGVRPLISEHTARRDAGPDVATRRDAASTISKVEAASRRLQEDNADETRRDAASTLAVAIEVKGRAANLRDPFGNLLAKAKGGALVSADEVAGAAREDI